MEIIVHPQFRPQSPTPTATVLFLDLPPCILHTILSSLLATELLQFASVSQESRRIVMADNILWRDLCIKQFRLHPTTKMKHSYFELYRFNLSCIAHVLSYKPRNQYGASLPGQHLPGFALSNYPALAIQTQH